jgi:hypothetical protein
MFVTLLLVLAGLALLADGDRIRCAISPFTSKGRRGARTGCGGGGRASRHGTAATRADPQNRPGGGPYALLRLR